MVDVLIADDSEFLRNLLRELLSADYDVVGEVENGVEAVEIAKEQRPDVVVMDVAMPIRDGVEATEEIKAMDAATGVVISTNEGQAERRRAADEAGADGHVTKPFQRRGLMAAVQAAAPP